MASSSSSRVARGPQLASMNDTDMNDYVRTNRPIRPPGLLPLPEERLWRPHEDKYWASIRDMWGSNVDLHDMEGSSSEEHSMPDNHPGRPTETAVDVKSDSEADLTTANGTVFRIVLPNQAGERDITPAGAGPQSGSERVSWAPQSVSHPSYLNNTVAVHMPPPALQKPASISSQKGSRRAFQGAALAVNVTTTTRTYGDFSAMNPPPYTPRPTGRERTFGQRGTLAEDKKSPWPVAKWLFILGFFFPLLWLFGSFLLFTGLRKLGKEAHPEAQAEANESKSYTHSAYDTTGTSVTHLIAQEVVWSKRCAWAVVIFAVLCFITLGILKGLGM